MTSRPLACGLRVNSAAAADVVAMAGAIIVTATRAAFTAWAHDSKTTGLPFRLDDPGQAVAHGLVDGPVELVIAGDAPSGTSIVRPFLTSGFRLVPGRLLPVQAQGIARVLGQLSSTHSTAAARRYVPGQALDDC